MADPFEFSKKVADGKYDSVHEALKAAHGDGIKDNVQAIPADRLFPVSELPAQELPSPMKLTK